MNIILGVIFLVAGRKIFWLFVASLGFLFGFLLSSNMQLGLSNLQTFVISLVFGLIGLFLAVFLQNLAVAFSGFIAGGYIFLSLSRIYGWQMGGGQWAFIIASGIIGSILFMILFNPALTVFSSFIGAMLIVQHLAVTAVIQNILFTVLFIIGILAQSHLLKLGRNSQKNAK